MKLKDVCIKGTSNIRQKDVNDSGRYPVYGAAGPVGFMNSFQYDEPYVGVVKDGAGIGRATYLPSNSSIIGTMQALIPKKNVLPKYLYYAVSSMHLEKYYSGATIPHIYFKNYKHERFVLVSKKEQEQIIWRFSLLEKMISNKQQQLLKLDELIKARFVEMFGDPISNKKSWKKRLLNDLVDKIGSGATPKGGKESYQDHGISFIRSMNVHDGYFNYKDLAYINSTQAKQLSNVIVQSQDVFINITGASVARSCIVPDDILPARVNQHVSIIRCKSDVLNPIFINNLFLNDSFKRILLSIGLSGGATRQAITKKQLEMLKIILPPISLQNEYANFVHQVDKSKVVIQKSLDETQKLYDSLMQEYFG
ncbi:restriction endonuclease subunit S [Limosilactobacillus reuteri subsp. reuteri]|uniref:Type I restriction modification DNA specificity domain protein n=1 Tax=Limosilactobacillus reuteri MM4-1A TaxID=548485 RepID=A0A828RF54_LIMRT|nr:type I restriction modification protein [Limosilactobacillus reuteri]EGC14282.1 type I restriction modification DNA specificity domain protein [Limosilactobacillus reuteri MM4-1A]